MLSHQLYRDRSGGELVACITFSNSPYADDDQPLRNESFDFRFPGVAFDSARHIFFARSGKGKQIPVGRAREGLVCSWVDLAPGAKIYLVKESGRVTATLAATDHPRVGSHWIAMDNNFSLQNILTAMFGELGGQPDN
jgi:hypothetical protein